MIKSEKAELKEQEAASGTKKTSFDAPKILAYVTLGFLGLVAFGFGGPQYTYIYSALGFILAVGVLTLIPHSLAKDETKALLYYSIPLIVFALFTSFSRFHSVTSFGGLSNGLINLFGICAFFGLGFLSQKTGYVSLRGLLFAALLGFSLFALINCIISLAEYGPFYVQRYAGAVYYYDGTGHTISSEYSILFSFKIVAVSFRYGLEAAFLSAASLIALLFVSPKQDKTLFITIAICGGIGLLSLILVPYLAGLLLLIPVLVFGLLVRFVKFPPDTPHWEKVTAWVILGIGGLLLLIIFINGIAEIGALNSGFLGRIFNNSRYLVPVNEIIQSVFWKQNSAGVASFTLLGLFGISPTASGTWLGRAFEGGFYYLNRIFEFNALYEGGLLAFLGLLVGIVFAIISLRKFLHSENGVRGEKILLVALLLGWFIYASLESDSFPVLSYPNAPYRFVSPIFHNNFFLVMMALLGASYQPIFLESIRKKARLANHED